VSLGSVNFFRTEKNLLPANISKSFSKSFLFESGYTSEIFSDLVKLNESLYLAGSTWNGMSDERLTKADTAGNIIWSYRRSPSWDHDGFGSIVLNAQNQLICYGQQNNGASYFDASWVIYDTSGVELSNDKLAFPGSNTGTNLIALPNGNFVAGGPGLNGYDFITLLNSSMQVIKTLTLPNPAGWDAVRFITDAESNVYVSVQNVQAFNSYLYKFSSDLTTVIWNKTISSSNLGTMTIYKNELYVGGTNNTNSLLIKMNKDSGDIIQTQIGSVNDEKIDKLLVLNDNLFKITNTNSSVQKSFLKNTEFSNNTAQFSFELFDGINSAVMSCLIDGKRLYLVGSENGWGSNSKALLACYLLK
jgi:hypothetical protein